MPAELPNEVWLNILKRLTSVNDWGQLQKVSRLFNNIIRAECWVQVKGLKYKQEYFWEKELMLGSLEINEQKLLLSQSKALLLLEELGKKANKIQSISLDPYRCTLYEEPFFAEVLKRLTSKSLKIQDVTLHSNCFTRADLNASLSAFIRNISGTLKNLEFRSQGGPAFSPELLQAFRKCRAFESIGIFNENEYEWSIGAMLESVLLGASQLKSLTLGLFASTENVDAASTALLNSGVHLSNYCDIGVYLFETYMEMVQRRHLAATDHPLKSVKTLTVTDIWMTPPWELFPDLQQLKIHDNSVIGVSRVCVNAWVSEFLSHYKDFPGEPRLLLIEVKKIYGCPTLEAVSGAMDWPVSWVEETETSMEFQFIRGNAAVKLLINPIQDEDGTPIWDSG